MSVDHDGETACVVARADDAGIRVVLCPQQALLRGRLSLAVIPFRPVEYRLHGMSRSGFQGLSVTLKPLFKRAYARPRMQGCYMDGVILECIIKMGHARERSANFKRSVGDGNGPLSSCDISQSETSHRSRRGGRYYVVRHHRIGGECGWDSSTTCRLRGNLRESGRIIGSCIPGVNRTCSSHRRSRGCR